MSEPVESDASLLVVILDINASAWARSPLSIDSALQQTIIFVNAYLALKPENQLVVLASSKRQCKCLYPPEDKSIVPDQDIQVYEQFRVVDVSILAGIKQMLTGAEAAAVDVNRGFEESQTLISRALSKALCHINRVSEATLGKIWSRILVVSAADDSPREYISLMNSIFAAQKMSVLIDVCKVIGNDSVFLQQAADISGGTYLKLNTGDSLLQTLMFTFLADHYTREIMFMPGNEQIDFRATCFCHKRVIDIGFVCSVCLSIFCKMAPVCSTCRTKFSIRLFRPENKGAPASNGQTMRTGSQQTLSASSSASMSQGTLH
ncbi:RNA polymerase II transcription factor B subunit 4 [Coemansia sp. RSA 1721]|nr:RNA polymerase II transcription factor B subunit 4 [Coemansia sp. RSA 1721]